MWFDKLTTNETNYLPFVLSLSKDLFSVSLVCLKLNRAHRCAKRKRRENALSGLGSTTTIAFISLAARFRGSQTHGDRRILPAHQCRLRKPP